ncbi:MAG: anthranilate phosphoribosyltransferase [Actinomycetota bacterium]|nr:anthranilate phosphoribosyltransferase [Actinomycetota bacterium]
MTVDPPLSLSELGGWPAILSRLIRGQDLASAEASAALSEILTGAATSAQIAAFATALHMKGETVGEMTGLVRTMLAHAERVPVPAGLDIVDTCGTGGDRSRSVNVSTMAALVVAGGGAPVCKHGNRAMSSSSGSADVLEALGVVIDLGPEAVVHCMEEAGMGFCFAPRFHPALRHAGPTRRELGVATVFNFLGPLANPARPRRQVVGVSDPAMAHTMLGVLEANGATRAMVVYGHDGLDELTTTTTSTILEAVDGAVRTVAVEPRDHGLAPASPEDLLGGDAATNADLTRRMLDGEKGPRRDVVLLNAAAGLMTAGLVTDLPEGLGAAERSVDDGKAGEVLERLVTTSREVAG